jgi:FMN phosphatase YigB (HAD superfamily)
LGVAASEALFVDDFAENIAGASAVGMQTLHFTDPVLALRQLAETTGINCEL